MYVMWCTLMTAPLMGEFVDTPKYSGKVGHHLCHIPIKIQRLLFAGGNKDFLPKAVAAFSKTSA
ncbi:unnamed protein product [Somion occarium]|uniref:Uncharacterized protein n=1 Tax=Somion occarium TaxID=3059160 RepID=A0ABP1D9J2_9APHY